MRNMLTAIVLLIGVACHAQVTPQYYIGRQPNNLLVTPIYSWGISLDSHVVQSLLLRDSFTTTLPPYGKVKNIYIRTGAVSSSQWKDCKATKVKLSLAHSSLLTFDTVSRHLTGLTQLALVDTLTTDTVKGGWIKIPVKPEVTFYIDTTKNFILEYALDTGGVPLFPQGSGSGCGYLGSGFKTTKTYYLQSTKSNYKQVLRYNWFFDFGFDLYPNPADVEAIQNVTDLRIYPNPSSGKFIISMAAERVVKEALLTVSDMAGRVIWQQQYKNIDDNFYQNLDLSQYPKGIYVAELRADGERITRKLVLQ